jgi:hypothetical protein
MGIQISQVNFLKSMLNLTETSAIAIQDAGSNAHIPEKQVMQKH